MYIIYIYTLIYVFRYPKQHAEEMEERQKERARERERERQGERKEKTEGQRQTGRLPEDRDTRTGCILMDSVDGWIEGAVKWT